MITSLHPSGIGAIVLAAVCSIPQPISIQQDFRLAEACSSYREMLSSTHPIVKALARGEIYAGMSRDDLLVYGAPFDADTAECYAIYSYVESRSFDYVSISMVNDRVTSASSGSCTWDWMFFGETPEQIRALVKHILADRYQIKFQRVPPSHVRMIERNINDQLVKLAECCQETISKDANT